MIYHFSDDNDFDQYLAMFALGGSKGRKEWGEMEMRKRAGLKSKEVNEVVGSGRGLISKEEAK